MKNRSQQDGFSVFLRGISVVGAAMLVIPVNLHLLDGTFPGSRTVIPLITFLLVCLGNFMQSIYCAYLGKRATANALYYDVNTFTKYHHTHAIIPLMLAIGISAGVFFLFRPIMEEYLLQEYMEQLYVQNPYATLVKESFVPYLCAFLCFVSQLVGIVIWFYPPVRLATLTTLLWGLGILFIVFGVEVSTKGLSMTGSLERPFTVCLAVFCVCITILYNQSFLENTYKGSVVSVFKPRDRMYNIFLVCILFVVLGIVYGISYIVVNGIYSLVSMIVWVVLYKLLFAKAADDPARQYEYFGMAEEYTRQLEKNNTADYIGLLIGYISVAILVFIGFKTGWFKRAAAGIGRWIMEIFGAILQKRNPAGHPEETFYQNYVDEERKTQNALIREYEKLAEHISSYKEFLQQLSRMPDAGAQLCFAYAVLVRMYAQGNVNLKRSDTPREVEFKVLRAVSGEEIRPITAAFEKIKYAEEEVSMEEASEILKSMCEIIHRYMV